MNRFITKSLALVALVGGMTAFSTNRAEAALSMQLTSYNAANVQLATTGVINDNVAPDGAPALGAIVFNGSVGDWQLNVDTGIGFPLFANQPHLDLNYTALSATGAVGDYLVIDFTESAEAVAAPSISTHIGGTNNSTITSAFVRVNGVQTGSLGPFNAASFSASGSATGSLVAPYSLTQRIVITRNAAGTVNASGDFEVIPEPATLSLFGLGMAGVAALRRRRQGN